MFLVFCLLSLNVTKFLISEPHFFKTLIRYRIL